MPNVKDVDKRKYNLDEVFTALKDKDAENLRCLYAEYSARMRHSGAQIWVIGSVFIPLSLSGIILGISDPCHTIPVAGFSAFLVWAWYFISARIDTALERDLAICAVIETTILKLEQPLIRRGLNELVVPIEKKREIRLRHVRLAVPIAVTVGWLLVAILSLVI